jgi:hypothetical protein
MLEIVHALFREKPKRDPERACRKQIASNLSDENLASGWLWEKNRLKS